MSGWAAGAGRYLGWLLSAVIFPIAWARSLAMAKRHTDTDPRGVVKVGAGIVAGLLLAIVLGVTFLGFHADNTAGIYETLGSDLSKAVGNDAYLEAVDLDDQETIAELRPNHHLFESLAPLIDAQDDRGIQDRIDDSGISFENMEARVDTAFADKDSATGQLGWMMNAFVYPGIVGALFGPVVITVGMVLRNAWEPSDTVGFKPYPSLTAGLFLILGGFGIPALPFAAWAFKDMDDRSTEGQISL